MHPYKRSQRVAEVVRRVVSEDILHGLKLDHAELITVTDVEMTPDLRIARVFVSYLGPEEDRDTMLRSLNESGYRLKKRIGSELRLKYTPELQFRYDDTYDRGSRIDALLDSLHPGDNDGGERG